jgi:hypothetical protein
MLERPVQELCAQANAAYRRAVTADADTERGANGSLSASPVMRDVAGALMAAAASAGEFDALLRIMDHLRREAPAIAEGLGW